MSKLPAITLLFWLMKIAATTLGETAGDLLSMTLKVGYAASSVILVGAFVGALGFQLGAKTYRPWLYWLVILTTSTAGTTLSDFMNRTLHFGYATGSVLLLSLLAAILFLWRRSTGDLSVAGITDRKSEVFYWSTILISNTLGTSVGDFLADDSGLGFAGGAALLAGALLLFTVAFYATSISRTLLFWAAFVLTRPLGATFGDILTKGRDQGGLDLGTVGSSGVLLAVLILTMFFAEWRKRDVAVP